ncbi:MAG: hypothetical protein C4534_01960 [Gaiellales bacterium]|nr:MAG: hypothetical protein C4534_01960 [Gaiellales bacterium]
MNCFPVISHPSLDDFRFAGAPDACAVSIYQSLQRRLPGAGALPTYPFHDFSIPGHQKMTTKVEWLIIKMIRVYGP